MDADTKRTVPHPEDVITREQEGELDSTDTSNGVSSASDSTDISNGVYSASDKMQELESTGEILSRVELNIACACEKLINLNILVMHVETMENELEAYVSDRELNDSVEKVVEFDLLSGVLDSEVRELESFMSSLQMDVLNARGILSSCKHLGETLTEIEGKLNDSEQSLKQSLEQISDIKVQCASLQRILSSFGRDATWEDKKDIKVPENSSPSDHTKEIKMQTPEQQRRILCMLNKSLASELDLEMKINESMQMEEDFKLRLQSSEQEVLRAQKEAELLLERFYQANITSEVLMGISKELLGQLQILQLNLKVSARREQELNLRLENTIEQVKVKDTALHELESRVTSLENKLSGTEIELQHAKATAEASQEKQLMSSLTIKDMENLIENLKSKVSKAESQTEIAEERCILLSETNADLSEELSFLRDRTECLEVSLHKAEETKKATAKDISLHSKFIAGLIMQMALERERLEKQMFALKKENKILVNLCKQTGPAVKRSCDGKGNNAEFLQSKLDHSTVISTKGSKEATSKEATNVISACSETEMARNETQMDDTDSSSNLETARNIDARQLNIKFVSLIVLLFVIPLLLPILLRHLNIHV